MAWDSTQRQKMDIEPLDHPLTIPGRLVKASTTLGCPGARNHSRELAVPLRTTECNPA